MLRRLVMPHRPSTYVSTKLCTRFPTVRDDRVHGYGIKRDDSPVSHNFLSRQTCVPSLSEIHESIETFNRNVKKTSLGLTFCTQAHGRRDLYHSYALCSTVKTCIAHIFNSKTTCVSRCPRQFVQEIFSMNFVTSSSYFRPFLNL